MKSNVFLLLSLLVFLNCNSLFGVEYLVTDTNGTQLGGSTSNQLDLGHNPVPQTIQVWMTYSAAEQTTANSAGGLFSGGVLLNYANPRIALTPLGAGSFTNPNSIWSLQQTLWAAGSTGTANYPQYYQASFNRGTNSGLTLDGTLKILVAEFVVSPGDAINSTGTTVSLTVPGTALFKYGSSSSNTAFSTQPSTYNFTVVPEPSTYVFVSLATGVLSFMGYRRRPATNNGLLNGQWFRFWTL
jgi:hypothetical protein